MKNLPNFLQCTESHAVTHGSLKFSFTNGQVYRAMKVKTWHNLAAFDNSNNLCYIGDDELDNFKPYNGAYVIALTDWTMGDREFIKNEAYPCIYTKNSTGDYHRVMDETGGHIDYKHYKGCFSAIFHCQVDGELTEPQGNCYDGITFTQTRGDGWEKTTVSDGMTDLSVTWDYADDTYTVGVKNTGLHPVSLGVMTDEAVDGLCKSIFGQTLGELANRDDSKTRTRLVGGEKRRYVRALVNITHNEPGRGYMFSQGICYPVESEWAEDGSVSSIMGTQGEVYELAWQERKNMQGLFEHVGPDEVALEENFQIDFVGTYKGREVKFSVTQESLWYAPELNKTMDVIFKVKGI